MKIGVQKLCNQLKKLDSGFRRNDKKWCFSTFYEFINIKLKTKPLCQSDEQCCYFLGIPQFWVDWFRGLFDDKMIAKPKKTIFRVIVFKKALFCVGSAN